MVRCLWVFLLAGCAVPPVGTEAPPPELVHGVLAVQTSGSNMTVGSLDEETGAFEPLMDETRFPALDCALDPDGQRLLVLGRAENWFSGQFVQVIDLVQLRVSLTVELEDDIDAVGWDAEQGRAWARSDHSFGWLDLDTGGFTATTTLEGNQDIPSPTWEMYDPLRRRHAVSRPYTSSDHEYPTFDLSDGEALRPIQRFATSGPTAWDGAGFLSVRPPTYNARSELVRTDPAAGESLWLADVPRATWHVDELDGAMYEPSTGLYRYMAAAADLSSVLWVTIDVAAGEVVDDVLVDVPEPAEFEARSPYWCVRRDPVAR